jgi:hypothetical protein
MNQMSAEDFPLTGTWNLTIATPMGDQSVELVLTQTAADEISGVSRNELEGEMPLQEPKVSGSQVSWKSTISKPIKVTAKMDCTFTGDTCTGTAKAGVFPGAKITGHRAS